MLQSASGPIGQGGKKGVCATVTVLTTTRGRRQFVLSSSSTTPGDRPHRVLCEQRPWRETTSPCWAYVRRPSRTWCPTLTCSLDTPRSHVVAFVPLPRTCVAYLSGVVDAVTVGATCRSGATVRSPWSSHRSSELWPSDRLSVRTCLRQNLGMRINSVAWQSSTVSHTSTHDLSIVMFYALNAQLTFLQAIGKWVKKWNFDIEFWF